jgi:pimeloyl-ACP methyl ester carboxylesterase
MFISSGDATLFTITFGAGTRSLLATGGWAGSWEVWAPTLAVLSRSWRVAAYDHRGTGATISPVASITVEHMVADLFAVADALALDKPVLAAESAGATIALLAALRQPARFAGLVIVDGLIHHQRPPDGDDRFAAGLRTDFGATIASFANACVPDSEPNSAAIRRWGRQILARSGPASAAALYDCLAGLDLRARTAVLDLPTLVIHGEADALVPASEARELVGTLPNSALHLIPGAGHVPTMTRPVEVATAIDHFFLAA